MLNPCLFDFQIVVEEFLEDINNILNSGEVPNLFEPDEYEQLIIGCRAGAKEAGIAEGNRDAIYDFCINRVRYKQNICDLMFQFMALLAQLAVHWNSNPGAMS